MTVDEMKAELRRQAATWFNNATLLVLESFIAEYDKLAAEKDAALIASQAKRIAELGKGVVAEIAAERRRQIEGEGWTPEHDDQHASGEIALAAGAYASFAGAEQHLRDYLQDQSRAPLSWPWHWKWWKPTTRRRDLVKAGALILAEIERLDRARATLNRGEG